VDEKKQKNFLNLVHGVWHRCCHSTEPDSKKFLGAFFKKHCLASEPAGDRGFALLIVLWSLVLIALLTSQILASGRTALVLAGNLREAAQARGAADGAINEALFHLLIKGADHWPADGSLHVLGDRDMPIAVRISSLAGKINPNLASTKLLAGLFQAVGSGPGQAQQLADAVIDWRSPATKKAAQVRLAVYQRAGLAYGPPGHNFADLSELADVIGMPPALLAKALPHMSLYQSGDPDQAQADPEVRKALKLSGQTGANSNVYEGNLPVVSIEAVAGVSGKVAVRREAIVSIAGQNGPAPFQFLSLTDGY
jgi:general secretion pathway protein K